MFAIAVDGVELDAVREELVCVAARRWSSSPARRTAPPSRAATRRSCSPTPRSLPFGDGSFTAAATMQTFFFFAEPPALALPGLGRRTAR